MPGRDRPRAGHVRRVDRFRRPPGALADVRLSDAPMPAPGPTDSLYLNRELSWLAFNARVLHEATDPRVPLLERVKFLSIFSSNLDEYFQVRVGGLRRQAASGVV